ncbi:CvpA family protein [Marinobacterium arenosum]|uniref:CvpA family protein n=1 Tax=Marinobacterium arenosum TaxID=2862496 RepID=UPI001C96D969|nr:CvpA family protein [Marinobacterium arenosum]MBY4675139.1 CvpA family protein [Marinobacterium arenosum]
MNWADWIILGIIAISSLFSLKRGFMREALSLVTWVAAFVVARLFSDALATLLAPYIQTPSLQLLAAFAILFIATLLVGAVINNLVGMLVDATGLSGTDRMLGVGFGIARGGLLVIALIALVGMTPATEDPWWQESQLIPHFKTMEAWSRNVASDMAQVIWNAGR